MAPGTVRIPYYSRQAYKNTAKQFGLMDDFRVIIIILIKKFILLFELIRNNIYYKFTWINKLIEI